MVRPTPLGVTHAHNLFATVASPAIPEEFPDDERLRAVLRSLGVAPADLLGQGGEAWVYAVDDERVVRVLHAGQDGTTVEDRRVLVDELRRGGAPFALPEVLEAHQLDGRWYAIERRLPGEPLMALLGRVEGADRDRLVEAHLEAAASLHLLHLEPRGWYGDLLAGRPVRAASWRAYLRDRAAANLARSTPPFRVIDAAALADELPEATAPAFVHLDAFAGNMMAAGTSITAVLDVGVTSVVGDARLDPLSAAVYLASPQITPVATPRDVDVATSWLRAAGLAELFSPARRWLAAYWSAATGDSGLHAWCRSVLLPSR